MQNDPTFLVPDTGMTLIIPLRSFGHQGALFYVFLASGPLKTLHEYAVFTLHTRGPKV